MSTTTTTIKLAVSVNSPETLTENEVGEFVFDLFWKLLPTNWGQETDLSYVEIDEIENVDGNIYEMQVTLDLENGATPAEVIAQAIGGCPRRWDDIKVDLVGFDLEMNMELANLARVDSYELAIIHG